ncbi:MAG: DNA adenine methylase [Spirochaetaceae bacterium]|jgi:adenine-specific DNA-methyltransferase|nr:DNA adenine methylase [Spirochaetaceae bacterium]
MEIIDSEPPEAVRESKAYLTRQIITCLGNKRALLDFIGKGIRSVQNKLGKEKLSIFDAFSGSGIVARYCKRYADLLIANDLERYSAAVNECYLSNRDVVNLGELKKTYRRLTAGMNDASLRRGIIAELYAPKDTACIQPHERVFYTPRNAMYIDTLRQLIEELPDPEKKYFLAPLLSEASIHANTSGVFKGFYKNRETGLGQFGGKNQDSLSRITGKIRLPFPVFSNFNAEVLIYNENSNDLIQRLPEVDLAYVDPPYNQHPYGANYFMLNLIVDYTRPEHISGVSGIPADWNRSDYNKPGSAYAALYELVSRIRAKYVLVSFNSEGFITLPEMKDMLQRIGKLEILETDYNTFRGSRNLHSRGIHVKEYLYLLEK